jgi:hypothetical protein
MIDFLTLGELGHLDDFESYNSVTVLSMTNTIQIEHINP